MGIFSDILEHNRDVRSPGIPLTTNIYPSEPCAIFKCPICSYTSSFSESFREHLQQHNNFSTYLILNDIVLSPVSAISHHSEKIYLVDSIINNIQLVCTGISEYYISIFSSKGCYRINPTPGQLADVFDMNAYLNIFRDADKYTIRISSNLQSVFEFVFFVKEIPNFDPSTVDLLVEKMHNKICSKTLIDWSAFDLLREKYCWNNFELRYYNGFFDYYYACDNFRTAGHQLLIAKHLLYPFINCSPRAANAVRYVAFHLNQFQNLNELCSSANSLYFFELLSFFRSDTFKIIHKKVDQANSYGVYIPDQDLELMNIVYQYLHDDLSGINEYIKKMKSTRDCAFIDDHTWDKICLVAARYYRKKQIDEDLAEFYYDQIKAPYFAKEVEAFRNEYQKE